LAVSPARGIQTAHYEELLEIEEGNQLEEQKRLLYVAATRAKRLLALPLFWQGSRSRGDSMLDFLRQADLFPSPDKVPLGDAKEGIYYWDTAALRADLATAGGPRPALPEGAESTAADLLAARGEWLELRDSAVALARRGRRIVRPSVLEAAKGGGITPADVEEEGPGGRTFGSLFHAVMERLPLSETKEGELEHIAGGLAQMEAPGLGADEAAAAESARLAVQAARNDEFGGLLAESQRVRREVPFAVPLRLIPEIDAEGEGFLEGSIDLLVHGGAGTRILDYKTDRLYATDPAEAAGRYWPQLALYGLAARQCGHADGPVELIVYFVRPGVLCRRGLDEELLEEVRADLARSLAAQAQTV
jgi:ATP-dependent exoDNAse (exonuclease V) beta subunit